MKIKIYISANRGMPNLQRSLGALLGRVKESTVCQNSLTIIDAKPDDYEYKALQRIWLDCQTEDFYGLYLHCKGSSKTDEVQLNNGIAWMHYMADGVLDRHHVCCLHLANGADLVGSMWYRHFKGNFFWFKSSYLKQLADPYHLHNGTRFAAEYWCSQAYWQNEAAPKPKVKNLFYLPLKTDDDFWSLRSSGYKPDFQARTTCYDLDSVANSGDYTIYDDFILPHKDYEKRRDLIFYFANYNANYYVI